MHLTALSLIRCILRYIMKRLEEFLCDNSKQSSIDGLKKLFSEMN